MVEMDGHDQPRHSEAARGPPARPGLPALRGEVGEELRGPLDRAVAEEAHLPEPRAAAAPKCVIGYRRRALVGSAFEPGLRVTFDEDLRGERRRPWPRGRRGAPPLLAARSRSARSEDQRRGTDLAEPPLRRSLGEGGSLLQVLRGHRAHPGRYSMDELIKEWSDSRTSPASSR